jgi:hypothetical protein
MHLTLSNLVAFAGSTCGVLGFWSYVRGFVKSAHEKTVNATAIATAQQLAGQIDERTKQLVPNGGSSLRDDVTAIRNEQGEIRRTVGALADAVHALNGRLDTLADSKASREP